MITLATPEEEEQLRETYAKLVLGGIPNPSRELCRQALAEQRAARGDAMQVDEDEPPADEPLEDEPLDGDPPEDENVFIHDFIEDQPEDLREPSGPP